MAEKKDRVILNAYYHKKDYHSEEDSDDWIAILYKDNETGEKHHKIIKNPTITFYEANNPEEIKYPHLFIEKDKVHPVTVPYRYMESRMWKDAGREEEYKDLKYSGDYKAIHEIHRDPMFFSSDLTLEDFYREKFAQKYTNNICKVTKAYFDIETDIRFSNEDFVRDGECPINAISLLDEFHKTEVQFLLRNPQNPLIEQYESDYMSGRFTEEDIRDFICQAIGGPKPFKKYHMDEYHFELRFFDDEISLLKAFFGQVYVFDPDFIEGWNSSAFDLNYIIARIIQLGYNPTDIMCDPNWEIKYVINYVDMRNLSELAERGDFTFITCNTVWIDQEIQYASKRKASIGSYKSFKLDDIGELVAHVHKLDYSHITHSIKMLPWVNFKVFSLYNLMDTVVQHCIEQQCNDIEYIFSKAVLNCTSYKKVHRQTVYLINRMRHDWLQDKNYVMGNNVNKYTTARRGKFEGALVMDPLKFGNKNKLKMSNGTPINVVSNCIDFDYKALYPSGINEQNIAKNTQIGRLDISNRWKAIYKFTNKAGNPHSMDVWIYDPKNAHDFPYIEVEAKESSSKKAKVKIPSEIYLFYDENFHKPVVLNPRAEDPFDVNKVEYDPEQFETIFYEKIYPNENQFNNELYTRGGEFIENKVTGNQIEFCHRWFNLANFREVLDDIQEYYRKTRVDYSGKDMYFEFNIDNSHNLQIVPAYTVPEELIPVYYYNEDRIHPVSFYYKRTEVKNDN